MEWHGVEIEIEVPCAEGQKHPVRPRFTGWGEFEVAYNPCEELLGPVFARMAACTHYLHEEFPEAFCKDTDLKRRLLEALVKIGTPAVLALSQALGDSDWNVRRAACAALGRIGDPQAIPALIQALGDYWYNVRRAAAEALGKIGDPQAAPALSPARGDVWDEVRFAAAEALVTIGTPAVPALIQALGDDWGDVRVRAAEALGKLGDPQAVPALIQALGGSSEYVRRAAAEALVTIGTPAVPHLIQALEDKYAGDWSACRRACEVLGAIGDSSSLEPLKALRQRHPELAREVEQAIERIEAYNAWLRKASEGVEDAPAPDELPEQWLWETYDLTEVATVGEDHEPCEAWVWDIDAPTEQASAEAIDTLPEEWLWKTYSLAEQATVVEPDELLTVVEPDELLDLDWLEDELDF